MLEMAPKVISEDVAAKLASQEFLFQLYHKMSREDFVQIVKGFPYMLCL